MDATYYIEKVKFQLTGDVLECELSDESFKKVLDLAIDEVNRYYDQTQLVTVNQTNNKYIDLVQLEKDNNIKINSISQIYRSKPNGTVGNNSGATDPMMLSQWNTQNNFYSYGTNRWAYNYMAYNTTNQISNTLSTDLDFKEDKLGRKLLVNFTNQTPAEITVEYIPLIEDVSQVNGFYWIDIISRLTLAYQKIELGRIRTRFVQTGALYEQDGQKLLEEGQTELKAIEERLIQNQNMVYPLD